MMDLNLIWYILYAVLIGGYAVLDGFDLGVGVLHLFARDEHERRIHINAIGPVWDGNEVWLLTAGGALFAAFPRVYATVFSSFYLALVLLLVALIFRAVSMEFRGKVESTGWRRIWDWAFGIGSLLPAILFGVAVGNILQGIPIDSSGTFTGSFLGLLNPYAIGVGVLSLAMFTMHGAIYLAIKSEGPLLERLHRWLPRLWIVFVCVYALLSVGTVFTARFLFEELLDTPLFWILFVILLAATVSIPVSIHVKRYTRAFFSSSVMILSMVGLAALSLFPMLVPSSTDLSSSLTIYNACSSQKTLGVMLVIALIGMPLVLVYTIYIYRVFRGKVTITEESY